MNPLFSFSGIASGIDTASLVSGLVQLERQPIVRIENKQSDLQGKKEKFEKLRSLLETLQTKSNALDARSEVLTSKASSSQDGAVGVTVDGGASLGSFKVNVTQLATAQRTYSGGFSSSTTAGLFGTGTLEIQVGSDDPVTIDVDANSTLESVMNDINRSGANVTAGVLFTGSEYHLQVTGNDTGAANAISFTESGVTLNLTDTKEQALDAAFTVDGFTMSSASNVVSGAIPGVTLELKDATDGDATVSVQRDPEALANLVDEFVSAYNEVNTRIAYELRPTSEPQTGSTLFGESVVRTIQQKLRNTVIDTVDGASSPYNYMGSIGVSIDRTGKLSLDREKLEAALADDPEAVASLLMNDDDAGTVGVMGMMDTAVDELINLSDGLLTTRTKGIDDRIRGLDDQIFRMEARIDKYETQLRNQFTAMEMALSTLQGQGAQLSAILGG